MLIGGALLLLGLLMVALVSAVFPAAIAPRESRRERCPSCRSEDIVVYGAQPLGTCLACGSEFEFEFEVRA